jgi:SPX domain protein involved in polyphosphate accumulation
MLAKLGQLESEARQLGQDFLALEKFVNLNYQAFEKLLKNHDKLMPGGCGGVPGPLRACGLQSCVHELLLWCVVACLCQLRGHTRAPPVCVNCDATMANEHAWHSLT